MGNPYLKRWTTAEERIEMVEEFCRACDRYRQGRPCGVGRSAVSYRGEVYSPSPERYAMRGWCGWARVLGQRVNLKPGTIEFHDGKTIRRVR